MNGKEHKRNPKPTTDMIHKRIAFLCMLLPCTLWGQTDRTSPTGYEPNVISSSISVLSEILALHPSRFSP